VEVVAIHGVGFPIDNCVAFVESSPVWRAFHHGSGNRGPDCLSGSGRKEIRIVSHDVMPELHLPKPEDSGSPTLDAKRSKLR